MRVTVGQASQTGPKPVNQDRHGIRLAVPGGRQAVVAAIADGISTSASGGLAAELAVTGFLADYAATPAAWPVRQAGYRVIAALNAWLHGQTRQGAGRFAPEQGHVTTLSVLVLEAGEAHVFHVGDTRIDLWRAGTCECLTEAHVQTDGDGHRLLARALGVNPHVDVAYRSLVLLPGDHFVLSSDGAQAALDGGQVLAFLEQQAADLEQAAQHLVAAALQAGSQDNVTVQLVRVDAVAPPALAAWRDAAATLPLPARLAPDVCFDGYRLLRALHGSHRSQVWLAEDQVSGELRVLKVPGADLAQNTEALMQLYAEEWVARRFDHPNLLRAAPLREPRSALYVAFLPVTGESLAQSLRDEPQRALGWVRSVVHQGGAALQAMHRQGFVHGDVRPENVLVDAHGRVTLIDFGAVRPIASPGPPAGNEQFGAPEQWLGLGLTPAADVYALAALTYYLLSGALPYGSAVARIRHPGDLARLRYVPLAHRGVAVPRFVDQALQRALHPMAHRRPQEISAWVRELDHPPGGDQAQLAVPWLARDPVRTWQGIAAVLLALLLVVLSRGR